MRNFTPHLIYTHQSVKESLEQLNALPSKQNLTLFVLNNQQQVVGTLTDGDIRRGLLKNYTLTDPVDLFMRKEFKSARLEDITPTLITALRQQGIKLLPIINEQRQIVRVIDLEHLQSVLPLDAVIMAGGRGERLKPLTDTTPKPLLRIGDKPIIEHNVDRLCSYGINNFAITIRYLGEQLIDYFGSGESKEVLIEYTREDQPLGTIGSLKLVKNLQHDHVLLMNSDLLTTIDFEDFYTSFLKSGAEMAVATIPYKVSVPYAVLETAEEYVMSLKEKPTYTYYSNAGIYILKRSLIDMIPSDEPYNATDLMEALIEQGRKVGHYPILGYWLDIGKHEDFQKAQEDIKHLQL